MRCYRVSASRASGVMLVLLVLLSQVHGASAQSVEQNNYWLFLIWVIITSTLYGLGGLAMYLRRDHQPVKAPDPFLILVTNTGFFVATLLRCLLMVRPMACIVDVWETPIAVGIINGTYLLRAWKMYFKFELAFERSKMRGHERDEAMGDHGVGVTSQVTSGMHSHFRKKQAWYSRHQYLISTKFTVAFTSVLVIWFTAPAFATTFFPKQFGFEEQQHLKLQDEGCYEPRVTSIFISLSGLVLLFLCLHLAKKLRSAFDAFGIKQELTSVIHLICISWTCIVLLIGFEEYVTFITDVFSMQKLLPLMFFLPMFYQTSIKPVFKSFEHHGHLSEGGRPEDDHDLRTLQGVLHHPAGFQSLETYLVGCFCVESILFWRDIEDFKKLVHSSLVYATQQGMKTMPNLSGIVDQANEIADTYIYEDSTMQVNISASQRQQCEEALRIFNAKYLGVATPGHSRVSSFASTTRPMGTIHAISIGLQKKDGNVRSAGRASLSQAGRSSSEEQQLISNEVSQEVGVTIGPAGAEASDETPRDKDYIDPDLAKYYDDIVNVFKASHEEVFQLMRTDIFPRYIETEEYKTLVEGIENERAEKKELADLKIL